MSDLSPAQLAKHYRQAIAYLDRCGEFNEQKLREVNRIAGGQLREGDIQDFVRKAPLMMSFGGQRGGMEGVREELRKTYMEGIAVFGSLAAAGVGSKPWWKFW